jgi:chromosome segregation ATPase
MKRQTKAELSERIERDERIIGGLNEAVQDLQAKLAEAKTLNVKLGEQYTAACKERDALSRGIADTLANIKPEHQPITIAHALTECVRARSLLK